MDCLFRYSLHRNASLALNNQRESNRERNTQREKEREAGGGRGGHRENREREWEREKKQRERESIERTEKERMRERTRTERTRGPERNNQSVLFMQISVFHTQGPFHKKAKKYLLHFIWYFIFISKHIYDRSKEILKITKYNNILRN